MELDVCVLYSKQERRKDKEIVKKHSTDILTSCQPVRTYFCFFSQQLFPCHINVNTHTIHTQQHTEKKPSTIKLASRRETKG